MLPRLLATPLAGAILTGIDSATSCDHSREATFACESRSCVLGWQVLWAIVAVYFFLAAAAVCRIRVPANTA